MIMLTYCYISNIRNARHICRLQAFRRLPSCLNGVSVTSGSGIQYLGWRSIPHVLGPVVSQYTCKVQSRAGSCCQDDLGTAGSGSILKAAGLILRQVERHRAEVKMALSAVYESATAHTSGSWHHGWKKSNQTGLSAIHSMQIIMLA